MEPVSWVSTAVYIADLALRTFFSLRVIMRRLPVGVSLAWLTIILIFPFFGAILYLLIGEYRLGPERGRRALSYRKGRASGAAESAPLGALGNEGAALAKLAQSVLGPVPLAGNRLELLANADAAFPALIAGIDAARHWCFVETYIWSVGGRADEVGAALVRAAQRGVECRVLVDALGSAGFLRSRQCQDLRDKGVHVAAALSFGLVRLLFVRPDLRMHRKIAVIDGTIGYTGSMNIADPIYFKRDVGVGQWVDALARVQGPAVTALADICREDWFLETGELIELARAPDGVPAKEGAGNVPIQVLPTGPDVQVEAIEQVVLMAIYGAQHELIMTTPYFVPSESLLTAIISAAARKVQVTLIVPQKIDSKLVGLACRAFQTDLLKAGVRVGLYRGGLLHTKSITIDGHISLFGSLNLDPRSFRLDLEITLAVYDAQFTGRLRGLQEHYLENCHFLGIDECLARSGIERFKENTARLVGPVL